MYTTTVLSSEIENRFDVGYYNPSVLELLRKIKKKALTEEFEVKDLSFFGKMKKGIFSIPASQYKESGVPFIRVSCIKNLTIDRNDITHLSEEWHKKEKKTAVEPGDIVISKSGTIGCTALVPTWMPKANISQDIIGFYVDNKKDSGFLAVYLSSKLGQLQMNKIKTQQTHAHLTLTPLRKLKVLYNSTMAEKISGLTGNALELEREFLEIIDNAKEKLENYFKISVINEKCLTFIISSKELDSKLTPVYYYPSYLQMNKKLNAAFQTVKLGKISELISGDEVGSVNYKEEGVCYIRTSDLVNYGIDRNSYHKINEVIYEKFKQDLKVGDILFTNDGKIGLSAVILDGDKCIIQSHIKRIRIIDERFSPEFVFLFLNTKLGLVQVYRRIFVQSTIPTIDTGLADIDIPLVDKEVMNTITVLVKKAFAAKSKRNAFLEESIKIVESMIE